MSDENSSTGPAHVSGTRKGEEMQSHDEPGHKDMGTSHADRPTGTKDARSSTSINPQDEEPITPGAPEMPPA